MKLGWVVPAWASSKPVLTALKIDRVRTFDSLASPFKPGPFPTKSQGLLFVNFAPDLGLEILQRFLAYDREETTRISHPMITIQEYEVMGLPRGDLKNKAILGGTEFHRIREEIVMCTAGQVKWDFEDVYGFKKEVVLAKGRAVWIPPFILHTYQALKKDTNLKVLCNTALYPDDPTTSDTYDTATFRKLQKHYQ